MQRGAVRVDAPLAACCAMVGADGAALHPHATPRPRRGMRRTGPVGSRSSGAGPEWVSRDRSQSRRRLGGGRRGDQPGRPLSSRHRGPQRHRSASAGPASERQARSLRWRRWRRASSHHSRRGPARCRRDPGTRWAATCLGVCGRRRRAVVGWARASAGVVVASSDGSVSAGVVAAACGESGRGMARAGTAHGLFDGGVTLSGWSRGVRCARGVGGSRGDRIPPAPRPGRRRATPPPPGAGPRGGMTDPARRPAPPSLRARARASPRRRAVLARHAPIPPAVPRGPQ